MLGYEEADELKIIKMVITVPVVIVFSLLVLGFDKNYWEKEEEGPRLQRYKTGLASSVKPPSSLKEEIKSIPIRKVRDLIPF